MKTFNRLLIYLLLLAASVAGTHTATASEPFRTDINPALRYYLSYLLAPDLPQSDRDYLFTNDWRGQKLPDRFVKLISTYNNQFTLVRQAVQSTVPCDWGIDLSAGPATLLPHLARNKAVAQAARLRALWHLQNGRPGDACDDLIGAFVLARNAGRDGTLIAVLVQIAMENILCSAVAENFYLFGPEQLRHLDEGMAAAPARVLMASCIPTEKTYFHDWLVRKITDLRNENSGDEAKTIAALREFFAGMGDGDQPNSDRWDQITKASGGTSEGVLKLVRAGEPFYQRLVQVMAMPVAQFEAEAKQFNADLQSYPNPLLGFPAIVKARPKEFAIEVELAMVHAAVEYQLHGEQGLRGVSDPCGQGPFEFQRFVFEGVDRGFQLKSAYDGRGFPEVLIFVEKEGPPFRVNGKDAGKPAVQ